MNQAIITVNQCYCGQVQGMQVTPGSRFSWVIFVW